MAWPAVKLGLKQEEFRQYVKGVQWNSWRPKHIMWHNTAAPTLKQWIKSADDDFHNGLVPGITRIKNLEAFFRDNNGWSGAPHLFIANDLIWVFNPLNAKGVHSPSFNVDSIGIEMIGDFDIEDDDTGEGLRVKRNTVFATAVLCEALGLYPTDGEIDRKLVKTGVIFLHKQDPKTTHECPGHNVAGDKSDMIMACQELMTGGEHDPVDVAMIIAGPKQATPLLPVPYVVTPIVDGLNVRKGPGIGNEAIGSVPSGTKLFVIGQATGWLRIKTPAGYVGWVSERYTRREA